MEADKLTISFRMFPIICIIFSNAYLYYFVADSITSIFLISFCSLFLFFSLNKIALHLSVNILIKFSSLVKDLKFCSFFILFFLGDEVLFYCSCPYISDFEISELGSYFRQNWAQQKCFSSK